MRCRSRSVWCFENLDAVAVGKIDGDSVDGGKPPAFDGLFVGLVFERFALTVGHLDIDDPVLILPVQYGW